MSTRSTFPTLDRLQFKAAQLARLPHDEDVNVTLETVIGPGCVRPLRLGLPFYVSHMSFGAVSKEAKVALSMGSAHMDTAIGSGEGGMLTEERRHASHWIYELGTAAFTHDEQAIRLADAVEIKIGQGVKPGLGGQLPADKVTVEIAQMRGLAPGEASVAPGRFTGLDKREDLCAIAQWVRTINPNIPLGIKLATGRLEEDIRVALTAKPDFLTIDCRGGATGSSPAFVRDHVGIPALYAIVRARRELMRLASPASLCVTGGFRSSADIVKGIALGADAVALASASLMAIGCRQSRVCHTGTCPTGIATQDEALRSLLKPERAARSYVRFASALAEEIRTWVRMHGKTDVHEMNRSDLMTTDEALADMLGLS